MRLAIFYLIFAVIATLSNILTQDLWIRYYQGNYALWVSMLLGTLVGLVVKYWLDKQYIFRFVTKNAVQQAQVFFMYAVMGVLTTAIFWSIELSFDYWFGSKAMRYLGAVLGLSIGYVAKYYLDKHFVFRQGAVWQV